MRLRYTPEALRDLRETKEDLETVLRNPTAAVRITKKILEGCGQLKQFPRMGRPISEEDGRDTGLRLLVVEHYVALYRIDGEFVSVARILHAKQDYLRILFGDLD